MKKLIFLISFFILFIVSVVNVSAEEAASHESATVFEETTTVEETTVTEEATTEEATTEEATTEETTTEETTTEEATTEETTTEEATTEEATTEEATTEEPEGIPVLLGDVDGDGVVSSKDARSILRYSVGLSEIKNELLPAGDINGDSHISAADARLALRTSVKLEDEKRHRYTVEIKSASTCIENGVVTYTCHDCENYGELLLPLSGHNMVQGGYRLANCKSEGYSIKKCSVCTYSEKTVLAKTGHIFMPPSRTKPKTCLVCGLEKLGWTQVGSVYCYFYKGGDKTLRAENCIVDGFYVDPSGARCDDPVINAALEFIKENSDEKDKPLERLRDCYNHLYKKYKYKTIVGVPVAEDLSSCAEDMFTDKTGNCYSYATALSYIGRALGYDTRIVTGKIRGVYGDMVPHSYAEIFIDGKWYIFDASQNIAYPKLNWFMITSGEYHRKYEKEVTYTLTASDGEVKWK